jgi:N-acetylglutamate synthase-like GNAT family acetyltransferase
MLLYLIMRRVRGVERRRRASSSSTAARSPVVLAQFSTRLPPELLERLRIAAPQLGMRQADVAATAIDSFLSERGFKQ